MNINCVKPNITDYSFLRLLTSSIILRQENPIINNHQLEKDLYAFYDRPEFHPLFEDICKKEDIANKNSYVDLSRAFQTAYAFEIIIPIHDNYSQIRSIVNILPEEAENIISEYDIEIVEAITSLCEELFSQKHKNQNILTKNK